MSRTAPTPDETADLRVACPTCKVPASVWCMVLATGAPARPKLHVPRHKSAIRHGLYQTGLTLRGDVAVGGADRTFTPQAHP